VSIQSGEAMRNKYNDAIKHGIPADLIGHSLGRAQAFMYESYAEAFSGSGIRPSQFCALAIIAANPGLKQCELAQALGIGHPRAVGFIDELEERGLVSRLCSSSDRRKYALTITPLGVTLCHQLREKIRCHERHMTKALTPDEIATLGELLHRITGH